MSVDAIGWLGSPGGRTWSPASSRPAQVVNGYDIHLLRGITSAPLREQLIFYDHVGEVAHPYLESAPILKSTPNKLVSLRFEPRFAAGAMVERGGTPPTIEGLGVVVNTKTGEVTAMKPAPAGKLARNFVLDLVAKLQRDDATTDTVSLGVRVHVHDRVASAWLTPQKLTVHRGSEVRFTVLAELATGAETPPLIGDLSRVLGITWSCPDASVTFGPAGEIRATKLGTFSVTAKLPAAWNAAPMTADIEVVEGWDEKPFTSATLVAGPGSARLDEVPNVLVISEGFTAEQEDDWNALVQAAFDHMARGQINRPFDLFLANNSINIWSLFIPSREPGSSALYELSQQTLDGRLAGYAIANTAVVRGMTPATNLNVFGANGFAGLPVRGDAKPASLPDQVTAFNAKLAEWGAMFGPVNAVNVTFQVWQQWTDASTRTLADERDTALGLAFGTRPRIESWDPDRSVTYHPFRTQRSDLDKLLARITDGGAPKIGQVWAGGKDAPYIVALVGGGRGGGAETFGVAAAAASEDWFLYLSTIGTNLRCEIVPHELPRGPLGMPMLGAEQRGTLVHELAHAFQLQDEYTEKEKASSVLKSRRGIVLAGNVMQVDELRDPAVPAAQRVGDGLVGDRLRWRHPRISRAAVLSDAVVQMATDEFVVPLRKGQKRLFKNGDIVFLRQRPLRSTVTVGEGDAQHTVLVIAKISPPLTVISDSQVGEQIVVAAHGAPFTPADFTGRAPTESIVFVPVPPTADAAAANETFADLVPLVVRKHITATGLPLNRKVAAGCDKIPGPDPFGNDPRQALDNIPANTRIHWINQWVGAFDGGVRLGCDVFHPSPMCAMNHHLQRHDDGPHGTYFALAAFCPVCSYLLVDAIDPSLHGEIDKLYAPFYVEGIP